MRCGTVSLPRGGIADHRGRYEGRVLQADHVPPCGWLRPHGRPRRGSRQALPLTRAEEYRCKAEEAERNADQARDPERQIAQHWRALAAYAERHGRRPPPMSLSGRIVGERL